MSEENIEKPSLPELDTESKKLLDQAQTLYNDFINARMRAGNLPGEPDNSPRGQAINKALKVLEKNPDDPRPLFLLGNIYHAMGELALSEDVLQRALKANFSNFDLHKLLAELLIERRAFDEVEMQIEYMMNIDKTRPELWEIKAELARLKGDFKGRLEAYEKLAEMNVTDERLPVEIATTLVKLGRVKDAISLLESKLETLPESAEVHFNLANLYVDVNRPKDALPLYKKTLDLNPDHNMARFELANLLDEFGRPKDSLELYREYMQVIKEDPDAYYNAGGVADRLEDRGLAIRYYLEFLKYANNPDDFKEVIDWINENAPGEIDEGELQIGIAQALLKQGDPESAIRELDLARGMGLDNRKVNFLEGIARQDLEDDENAIKLFEIALDKQDSYDEDGFTDDDILIAAGDSYLNIGNLKEAEETAKEILKGEAMKEDGYTLLGDIMLEKDDLDNAHKNFKHALSINMFSFDGLFGLGEVFDAREDYVNAATAFRQCFEIEPDDEDTLYRLGMDYLRLGHKEWGKFLLEKNLRLYPDGEYTEEIKKILAK